MVLVTGATGTVGGEVARQLIAAGVRPRLLVRDLARASELSGSAELVQADLAKPESLAPPFVGAERLFLACSGPERRTLEKNALEAAERAGVQHVVKLSVLGADTSELSICRWHAEVEQALRDSGLAWTMLRPGDFMSNALAWAPTVRSEGNVYEACGDGRFAPIDPADIATVAVRALTEPGHSGKAYALTGPESLSLTEQVQCLARVLGRPVRYVALTPAEARERLRAEGTPELLVEAILEFAAHVEAGRADFTLPTVAQLLGRPARTFEQWVRRHAEVFR